MSNPAAKRTKERYEKVHQIMETQGHITFSARGEVIRIDDDDFPYLRLALLEKHFGMIP